MTAETMRSRIVEAGPPKEPDASSIRLAATPATEATANNTQSIDESERTRAEVTTRPSQRAANSHRVEGRRPERLKPQVSDQAVPQKTSGSPLARLTERDRQTIMEYKLEARFDRLTARAKLKHFATTFPAGSPARAEVERAYNSL